MKKALDLIVFYLVVLFIGIISATLLYTFYFNVLNYITQREFPLFSYSSLLTNLIYISYCILFVITPIVSYYRIRHPGGVPQLIAYIILVVLTWFILFPTVTLIENKVISNLGEKQEFELDKTLTPGFFRKVEKNVYYFTKDFESKNNNIPTTSAVIINTNENSKVQYTTVRDLDNLEFKRNALPYKEITVKQSFEKNNITLPINFPNLFIKVQNANIQSVFLGDFYYIIYFFSFILILSCVLAISYFFSWKLLNSVLVFFVTIGILCVNSVENLPIISNIENYLMQTRFFEFLAKYVYESFNSVVNVLFSLIFITIGILKFAIHKHKK